MNFQFFIGEDIRLDPPWWTKHFSRAITLVHHMGKNMNFKNLLSKLEGRFRCNWRGNLTERSKVLKNYLRQVKDLNEEEEEDDTIIPDNEDNSSDDQAVMITLRADIEVVKVEPSNLKANIL
jgi:hypothetical protein